MVTEDYFYFFIHTSFEFIFSNKVTNITYLNKFITEKKNSKILLVKITNNVVNLKTIHLVYDYTFCTHKKKIKERIIKEESWHCRPNHKKQLTFLHKSSLYHTIEKMKKKMKSAYHTHLMFVLDSMHEKMHTHLM